MKKRNTLTSQLDSLLEWSLPHAGKLLETGSRTTYTSDKKNDYHLIRTGLPGLAGSIVTVAFELELKLPQSVIFYLCQWGGSNIFSIDHEGKVIDWDPTKVFSHRINRLTDEKVMVEIDFEPNHPSLSFGLKIADGRPIGPIHKRASFVISGARITAVRAHPRHFDFEITLLDVGARGGLQNQWQRFEKAGDVRAIFVEPEPTAAEKLRAEYPDSMVLESALSNKTEDTWLMLTRARSCSSILTPDLERTRTYSRGGMFDIDGAIPVHLERYDVAADRANLPAVDMIKIDVQGLEYEVLEGMGNKLSDVLAIELETQFYPIYKNQKLIGDIVALLEKFGFALNEIRPQRNFDRELVEVNAWFTRRDINSLSHIQRRKLEAICKILRLPGLKS